MYEKITTPFITTGQSCNIISSTFWKYLVALLVRFQVKAYCLILNYVCIFLFLQVLLQQENPAQN